ncbi:DUF2147 domain-containing protein [Thermomonas sp.]|jgi:uncharacterized protein (DUF2147 family)|uniref:DUF2147 domain-containing protein n=1 Tax=Thermomonas sp. TaxID=1971895 RepID=UPI001B3E17D4|nr:DUF2147 domain-containing protein [Thermomonas sp.]MBK6332269.1 DUF2147 domain-containing protein [Thermomonas sp.]MBK6417116.1 DUF2147 domain-containing protein [Thermomonas sp.]MBK6924348.1 DUF2147 domain-containing protein [Thermomonas sp.]MBK7204602.1 DUF2147 domain-containing protein [Thermomonas sp.]MBK9668473.1 DUF2147 domain-containing protein [Thermomonas sp.]
MRKIILAGVLASVAFTASAQDAASPIGKWKTLDDKSGKPMTITEVYMAKNGTMAARIVENLGLPATCADCDGEHKGKPMVGMVTLWNLKANKDGSWGGGSGYKPSEDREFNAKSVKLVDGGKKLEVKGCVSIICRTATWVRAN